MTFQDVEAARKVYWTKLKISIAISAVISIVLGFVISLIGQIPVPYSLPIVPAIFLFSIGIAVLFTKKSARQYRHAYKGYFIEQNFQKIFTSLSYSHDSGLDSSILKHTGMIDTGDLYTSNDLTIAKYKKVGFTQADVHIKRAQTDSEGHVTYNTIFKGRIMLFQFPKKFNFKLELVGKRFNAYSIPKMDKSTHRKMTKIHTESNEFNRLFKIYAQDDFETFYLLDPARIVKIQAVAERYKNKILLGFFNNQMLVAIDDGKDSFEPPRASKPINEKTEMAKVSSEIKVITDLVDQLSLAPIFS